MSKVKIYKFIYLLILLSIFISPILFFGINDVEGYYHDNFNIKYQNENFFYPFKFFIDFIGAGSTFPIAPQTPLYHPVSIIFQSVTKEFLFFFVILHLLIQVFFFIKILKILNIKSNLYITSFAVIFLIPNINYLWTDDWFSIFFSYSIFFPIIYYSLKLFKKDNLTFIQLTFWIAFGFVNSHLGHFFFFFFFLIIFFFLNIKNLKYIFGNKFFYFVLLLLILICTEKIYFIISHLLEAKKFNSEFIRSNQSGYILDIYVLSPILFFFELSWSLARFPFSGIFIFISTYLSLKFFFKKKSKDIFYLNVLFLILILFALSMKIHLVLPFISATWMVRDIINVIGLIIFFIYLKNFNFKKKIILSINILLIFMFTSVIFFKNFYNNELSKNNYLINKNIDQTFLNLKKIIDEDRFYNRLYLSPGFMEAIKNKKFFKYKIYAANDLIKLNFSPFQIKGKKIISDDLKIQKTNSSHTSMKPNYDEINSEIFLSIFNLKYLFIFKNELRFLNNKDQFIEVKKIYIDNSDELILLKRKNNNQKIILSDKDIKNIKCDFSILIDCINKFKDKFKITNNYSLQKIGDAKYQISVNNKPDLNHYLLVQFTSNKNWKDNKKNLLSNLDNRVLALKINNMDTIEINYQDTMRFSMILISLLTLVSLLTLLILGKIKKNLSLRTYTIY